MNYNKKYKLKPGRHQFVPGSHAAHSNDNLSDIEAEWYLEKYPHIAQLFEVSTENEESDAVCRVSALETTNLQAPGSIESPDRISKIMKPKQAAGVIRNKESVKSKK